MGGRGEIKEYNRNTSFEKRLGEGEEKDERKKGKRRMVQGYEAKGKSYDLFKVVPREIHYLFFRLFVILHFLNDCTLIFIEDLRQKHRTRPPDSIHVTPCTHPVYNFNIVFAYTCCMPVRQNGSPCKSNF